VPDAPDGWFEQAMEIVRASGGLVIADEVQAGFARSGNWWGYESSGFVPDIVCMGKPMGNGVPLSAVASTNEIVSSFRRRHHYFNTFAGSPLQAAAGMAVIDEITDRGLVASVAEVGGALRAALRELQPDTLAMGDVRGHGLFLGIDWVHPGTTDPDPVGARAIVEALKAQGMLIGTDGQHGNVLKIRPPLVFDHANARTFLDAFTAVVSRADD
jgi:4-aminobutyrate aminotransferase-like enzyme